MHSYDLILTLTGGLGAALVLGFITQRLGLSPIVGYLLEENNSRVREFIRDYSHSELLVFLAGCDVIACVEALAWLVRWSFSKGAFDGLIRRCD